MSRKEAAVDPAQSLPANEPNKGPWVGRRLHKQLAGAERRTSSSELGSEDDGTSSSGPGSEDDGSQVCGGGWRLPNDLSSLATLLDDRTQQSVGWELLLGGLTSMLILKKLPQEDNIFSNSLLRTNFSSILTTSSFLNTITSRSKWMQTFPT